MIDLENIRQDMRHLVEDIAPNKRIRRCSHVDLLFCYFLLEIAFGMIPGLVLLRELEVFVKLLSVLDK